jgi:uncharacterized protein (DUF924 family)
MVIKTANELLRFWFGDEYFRENGLKNDILYIRSRIPLWFNRSSPSFDQFQIDNSQLYDKTDENGDIFSDDEDWNLPKGLLAKIILYDQFPRSIYRGTERAFRYEKLAIACVLKILQEDWFLSQYSAIERLFIVT